MNDSELLPKYSPHPIKCPKCGIIDDTLDEYQCSFFIYVGTEHADEKIIRECRNCSYQMLFRPKDWQGPICAT